jgi:hypothetical protein
MKQLAHLIYEHHLFFAHIFLAAIGMMAGALCCFEGRMNRRHSNDVVCMGSLCLVTALLAFNFYLESRGGPFLLPERVLFMVLFIGTVCRAALVPKTPGGPPYPFFIPLVLVPVVLWAGLQPGLSYFSTFYPLAFSLGLIFIFSAKFHALSPVRTAIAFLCAAIVLFPLYGIFRWAARGFFPPSSELGVFVLLLTLCTLPAIVISNHAERRVYRWICRKRASPSRPSMTIPEGAVSLPFSMPDFTNKVIDGCFRAVGTFEVLGTACFRDSGKRVLCYRGNAGSANSQKEMDVPAWFLKTAGGLERPLSRKMFHLSPARTGAPVFLKKIVDWNDCEFILPVQEEGIPRVWVFVRKAEKAGGTREETVQSLLDHYELVQHVYGTSEAFKEDSDLRNLSQDTEEKRLSYQMMCRKVEEVNNAFRELKEKQQQLIESERWISFSQISVTLNHEINNPLSLVLGMAQFLQMKIRRGIAVSEKDFHKALSSIAEQGRRIMEIIKSLRRISVPVVEKYLPEIDMIKLEIKRRNPEE